MRVKFAYTVSIVTAVAMLTACGKKQDGEVGAGASAATVAAAPASEAIVVKIGHAAPLTGPIAHLGKDNENGARLAVEEINTQGLTIDGHKIQLELDARMMRPTRKRERRSPRSSLRITSSPWSGI